MIKNIVITGGSSGIGKNISNYLSNFESYQVINLSRKKNYNKKITNIFCDVSNYKSVQKAFAKIQSVDVLINNAGISNFSKNKIVNFEKIVQTNLFSVFYCSHEAYKKIKKYGRVINIASINAYLGFTDNPGYVASKGGIVSLTKSLALDYEKKKINVNSVSPGYIKTKMTIKSFNNLKKKKLRLNRMIVKKWGEPRDLFGVIDLLISDRSNYITGQDFIVDGGFLSKGI